MPEFVESDAYRGLIDLWKQVYSVGTEAHQLPLLSEYNWDFSNLRDAFQEGGILYGMPVYLFSSTEANQTFFQGQRVTYYIPVVVAIVSPYPPSDKIVVTSWDYEEMFDMQEMNMDWVPWVSAVERVESQIFLLSRVQSAGLLNGVNVSERWLPYFNHPFKVDDTEESTIVDIMYTTESNTVACEFDWEMDELEEFTNEHLPVEELSESQKDTFKQFVKEKVREGKRANREARERRQNAREEVRQEEIEAFEEMKFYKFYPVATADTPNISHLKVQVINKYFGRAHQVL